MNIVFIHPYITVLERDIHLSEPLGLLYLATYLKQVFGDDVQVTILDLYAMGATNPRAKGDLYVIGVDDETYIQSELKKLNPDLVGITCNFTTCAIDAVEVAAICKRAMPSVPVVMGGAHATIEGESILRDNTCVDFIVRGEGEFILEALIRALRGEQSMAKVAGLSFRKSAQMENVATKFESVVSNPRRELKQDTDMLPIPDRSYIDMERYKLLNRKYHWYTRKKPIATIMTSRGCPYDCVFCSTKVVWERHWRPIKLEKVFKEIEMLVSDYGIREIVINDDQFMAKKSRVHEFCDYFIARKLDLSFWYECGTSSWLLDDELLHKMRRAGFYAIRFPIETGCEKTMKLIKKPVDLARTKDLIVTANKLGYWTSANFIVGFPNETYAEILETVDYAYSSALDYAFFCVAKPNAGSELYEIYKEEGLLDQYLARGSNFCRSDHDTATMTAEQLNGILTDATGKWFRHKLFFYLSPKNFYAHLLPKLRTWEDLWYFSRTIRILLRKKVFPRLKDALGHRGSQIPFCDRNP